MLGGKQGLISASEGLCRICSRQKALQVRVLKRFKATVGTIPITDQDISIGRTEDIPGPVSLPLIGTLYKYIPFFGQYSFRTQIKTALLKYEQYGQIIREEIFPGIVHYHVYDPADIETLYREEGKLPKRMHIEGIKAYRLNKNKNPGLAAMDGEEWYKLRSALQRPMMRHTTVQTFMPLQFPVADDMVRNIRHLRDPITGEVPDFLNELYKWAMESISVALFGERVGCMDLDLAADSLPQQFIDTVGSAFEGLYLTTMFWGFHKSKKTKTWKKLAEDLDFIYNVFDKYASECIKRNSQEGQDPINCLVLTMLANDRLSNDDALTATADLFFGGVDTTAHSVAFNLFNLAKNPHVQERLFEEIEEKIPRGTQITPTSFNNMPYLKAVIKETFRLTPTVGSVSRTTVKDMVLSGYRIPKDSVVMGHTGAASLMEKYFDSPLEYRPERWLRDSAKNYKLEPFAVLPFGHGARGCIGRRFAEQELYLALAAIVRNFKLEYHHEDIGQVLRLISMPDKPLKFKFVDRE